MSFLKRSLATAAAAALLATTTAAAATTPVANPAASLSIAGPTRAGAPSAKASKLGADVPTTTLISIGILAALVVIVLIATKGSNGGSPSSP